MGKKSGNRIAGAKGKVSEGLAIEAQAIKELKKGDFEALQDLALPHVDKAMTTLSEALDEASWGQRITAANSIIEHAHGKSQPQKGAADKGLTVVINQLSTGEALPTIFEATRGLADQAVQEEKVREYSGAQGSVIVDLAKLPEFPTEESE